MTEIAKFVLFVLFSWVMSRTSSCYRMPRFSYKMNFNRRLIVSKTSMKSNSFESYFNHLSFGYESRATKVLEDESTRPSLTFSNYSNPQSQQLGQQPTYRIRSNSTNNQVQNSIIFIYIYIIYMYNIYV